MSNTISKKQIIFDATKDADKIKHLRFSNEFKIVVDGKSKVILGSNGIGKTTLYNFMKSSYSQYHYLDYSNLKDDLIAKGKKLEIGSKINTITQLIEEKQNILKEDFVKSQIKSIFGITSATAAKKYNEILGRKYGKEEEVLAQFNSDNFSTLKTIHKDQLVFLFKDEQVLKTLESYKYSIEEIRNILIESSLEQLEKYIDDDEKKCPVCDSVKEQNIREIVKLKLKNAKKIENNLARNIHAEFPEKTPNEISIFLNELKISSKIISEKKVNLDNIFNFIITNGDEKIIKSLVQRGERLAKIDKKLKILQKERDKFYLILENRQEEIKHEFKNSFGIDSEKIIFDHINKNISITLNREVAKYSTGEINLMVFVVNLYEGIASDKELIIIDDPLSSYDIINQYKNIYKIAEAHSRSGKKLLIFTHNIGTINISNSQNNQIFEYQYIEKNGGELFLQNIEPIDSGSSLKIDALLTPTNTKVEYIKQMISKEEAVKSSDVHKIFHYDEPFIHNGYSNDYLVSLVDNFNGVFENKSFKGNCIDKAILLTAVRVWIEKQFYLSNPKDKKLKGKMLGQKILYLFPEKEKIRWGGSPKVNRVFLMSKKVMLNQNTHTDSQPTPFEYALSLPLDTLSQEIAEIKGIFE